MKLGKLKHLITIEKKLFIKNEFGEEEVSWESFVQCYASIEPLLGREYFLANQTQSDVSHKVTIRWRDGINPGYRMSWNDRIFDITSCLNVDEMNVEEILYVKEFVT
jgi:SPP1 family predicted phage head-tail adaptor